MASEPRLFEDARDLLRLFFECGVEHLVVGAHALAAHGLPRATGDFDVLVRPAPDNAGRVFRALQLFGAPLEAHGVVPEDFAREGTVYQLGLPPRRIDLLTAISGVSFDQAFAGRISAGVEGLQVPVIGRAALIANKRASGRQKDLLDARALEGDE
jgi:hypothetical protein